jgi:TatD DNase family protein
LKEAPFIDVHNHHSKSPEKGLIQVVNLFAADVEIAEPDKDVLFSSGLHPWHISAERMQTDFEMIRKMISNNNMIAIGETGLDRFAQASMETQKSVFRFHLETAQSAGKPVIIHAVRTYPDVVEVYKQTGVNVKMIFHGFNGNLQTAGQLMRRGFYLSFGEALFDDRNKTAQVFRSLPPENIFLETDESQKSIREIYEKAAEIRMIQLKELKNILYQNFMTCFGNLL